ncbi:DEAD/DEAH box helicase [Gluconobacter potus]|uniref:DEAD/DEAH box helicase n=1 Tax=Gluconobacter potus TaxID=2724927 RepID=UPI0007860E18|nr:DEAD/DEAH box helicase [Gluconobacter potus]
MSNHDTTGKLRLRDYQQEAIDQTWEWLQNNDGCPIIDAAVGAGKSVIMAAMMTQACEWDAGARILMITHSSQLVQQNYAKLVNLWPMAPAGIYSAALKQKDLYAQILFATIQSIYKKGYDIGRVDLILVDECHTISRKEKTMWHRFLTDVARVNKGVRMIGFSGTPWRLGEGPLIEGDDAIFHGISYRISIMDLIKRGFLVPVTTQATGIRVETAGLKKTGGDYNIGQLTAAVDDQIETAVADFVERGRDRRTWFIFVPSVENARHVADAIHRHGISCEIVTADTPETERTRILNGMRAGTIRSAVSVGTLTTGVDVPQADMIVGLRPTTSSALLIQMIGRVLRLSPETGKTDALLCDYAGWLAQHGPVDLIEPPRARGKGGEPPTKQCEVCDTKVPIHIMECPTCGFPFPAKEKEEEPVRASNLAALSTDVQPVRVPIIDMKFRRNPGRDGKPDTLRITFNSMMQDYNKFLTFEPEANPWARKKSAEAWAQMAFLPVHQKAPASIDEAINRKAELRVPKEITVKPVGKYPEIVGIHYE